jgi:hypothetical protein
MVNLGKQKKKGIKMPPRRIGLRTFSLQDWRSPSYLNYRSIQTLRFILILTKIDNVRFIMETFM